MAGADNWQDAIISCDPPLGSVTVADANQLKFTVGVPSRGWPDGQGGWKRITDVRVWNNNYNNFQHQRCPGEDLWWELRLEEVARFFSEEDGPSNSHNRTFFHGKLSRYKDSEPSPPPPSSLPPPGPHFFHFTVKFRTSDENWHWIRDVSGLEDGEVLFRTTLFPSLDLAHYIGSLGSVPGPVPVLVPSRQQPEEEDAEKESPPPPSCLLWQLEHPIPAAGEGGRVSSYTTRSLGTLKDVTRWCATMRHREAWFGPRHGGGGVGASSFDGEAVLLSFLRRDGLHLVVFPVSGLDDSITTLTMTPGGGVNAVTRNDAPSPRTARLLVAVAGNYDAALGAVMEAAKSLTRSCFVGEEEVDGLVTAPSSGERQGQGAMSSYGKPASLVKAQQQQQLEDWYDGLAYCTWNGLGQNLSHDGILTALSTLHQNGIDVPTLIIDDNWQSVDSHPNPFYRRWTRFEADATRFPFGLKSLISEIRRRFPHIRNIAVWHGIFGYWGGTSPSLSPSLSPSFSSSSRDVAAQSAATTEDEQQNRDDASATNASSSFKIREFPRRDDDGLFLGGGTMTVVESCSDSSGSHSDVARFYDEFYGFLARECGVDAVKCDTQSFLDLPARAHDRVALTRPYQDAWLAAAGRHFGGKAIACMAQIPQTLLYSFARRGGGDEEGEAARLMVRTSDDFFPDEPCSHAWHIFCNAHNALLVSHLPILPDWDMFQTSSPSFSALHAAARCLSGGPVYITDVPGAHDLGLIDRMTARTPDGRLVVLRTSLPGRTADPYVAFDECRRGDQEGWRGGGGGGGPKSRQGRLLRIRTGHDGGDVVGTMGVFNLGDDVAVELVRMDGFGDLGEGRKGEEEKEVEYVVHRHCAGETSSPLKKGRGIGLMVEVGVEPGGFEILSAYRLRNVNGVKVAVLGLMGKMAGAAAVSNLRFSSTPGGDIDIQVTLKALGVLGVCLYWPTTDDDHASARWPSLPFDVGLAARGRVVNDVEQFITVVEQGDALGVLQVNLAGVWREMGQMPCSREEGSSVDIKVTLLRPQP